ncbi:hypothetical protein QTG54_000975 [Skeletonema marinoi]|uniref:Uncharacterized protein n=1 Tax=Skeletonema marinoi TaxID=267567 RepID=A0AAD9DIF7_9STRA|nr:hypothetical protein QTG54_000975 [Skeletonema marinoi]
MQSPGRRRPNALHFACDVDCQLFEGEERRRDPPSYDTVHALLCANFSSAALEDADEMSPLEYASSHTLT